MGDWDIDVEDTGIQAGRGKEEALQDMSSDVASTDLVFFWAHVRSYSSPGVRQIIEAAGIRYLEILQ